MLLFADLIFKYKYHLNTPNTDIIYAAPENTFCQLIGRNLVINITLIDLCFVLRVWLNALCQ